MMPGQEQPARVGQSDQPVLAKVEAADLIGGAVAVLHRANHAQPGVAVPFEVQHHVDKVLERTRAGDRAVLGDVANEDRRHRAILGDRREHRGDLPDLGNAARDAVDAGGRDRLHRIDDQQARVNRRDMRDDRVQVGLRGQVKVLAD